MLSIFLFPGRFLAEIGYLWAKQGQITTSNRRRESKLAHFILAIPFWAGFFVFGVPFITALFVAATRPSGQIDRKPNQPAIAVEGDRPAPAVLPDQSLDETKLEGVRPPATEPVETKPVIQFGDSREVVQSLPESAKRGEYKTCSATVTDHCIDQ